MDTKERIIKLERLAKKGLNISVRIPDPQKWKKIIETDPTIPRSYNQLRRLGQSIFSSKGRRPLKKQSIVTNYPIFKRRKGGDMFLNTTTRGILKRQFEECLEVLYARYFTGLGNPYLTSKQRDQLEDDMDADTPVFENSTETAHFILRWTNSSTHVEDNIADPSIVNDTGTYLETAWEKYYTVFGKTPYIPPGSTKMEVVFQDISALGVASPPDGPIKFDSQHWIDEPGIRQPSSAHELFHKLQYAFGFRTIWTPAGSYQWFSEGTPSWAEVFVWQRVSRAYKVTDLFADPDLNLYDVSYDAMPFWVFFQTRQQDDPDDNPLISFFQKYEATGNEKQALEEVIDEDWPSNNVYGQLDSFFALFSRERRIGAWRQTPTGGQPYATILGPDGVNIVPALTITDVPLGAGDSYINAGSVSPLGSDYYRFNYEGDSDGHTITLSVTGAAGGDYSYYLLWEKAGVWKSAGFPFMVTGDYGFSETIDLATADSLMLIISGRGIGGAYTINASVS